MRLRHNLRRQFTVKEKQLHILLILLILLAGLLLTSCTSSSTEPETASTSVPNVVTDIVWEWESLKVRDPNSATAYITTEIPEPEKYTLILYEEDGTFSGKADCNGISGTHEEGYASFTLGPSTTAFCGEDSLDQQYLDLLNRVVTGGPNGDIFALETPGGGERMEFRKGGVAPEQ